MTKTLVRSFPIQSGAAALLGVASAPLSAPDYLNFLTKIQAMPNQSPDGAAFKVWLNYRSILQAQGDVFHRVDGDSNTAFLTHDGPLAGFQAAFVIFDDRVELRCTYDAKVPLISWLIATVLDRALSQIAGAMDRYAATFEAGPT